MMFSADSELSEEEFLQAALMIENDLLDTYDVPLVGDSSASHELQIVNCKSQAVTSTEQQVNKLQTKSLTNVKAQQFFCLSQENDFDDDLSDDVLFNQVDNCQASISGYTPKKPGIDKVQVRGLGNFEFKPRANNLESSAARKRKFPGPAGALPKLKSSSGWNESIVEAEVSTLDKPSNPPNSSVHDVITSQSSVDDHFTGEAWLAMVADLEPNAKRVLSQFSVRSVIEMAAGRQLARGKVPVFCAVIESVNARGADACVTLSDPTGKMSGTVHRELVKEYTAYIQPGTVVVLRQASLLSPLGRNYYMNITPNNVVRLYPRYETGSLLSTIKLRELARDDLELAIPPPHSVTAVPLCSTPLRPAAINSVRPQLSCPGSALRSVRNSYPCSPNFTVLYPASAVGARNSIDPLSPLPTTIARSSSFNINRMTSSTGTGTAGTAGTASSNSFFRTPVFDNSRPSLLGEHRKLGEQTALTCSSQSPIVARSCQDTPKFTFKRTMTSPACRTVGKISGIDCAKIDQGDRSDTPNLNQLASVKNDDIWKTADIDDEVLFNLSAEFLSDF